MFLSIYKTSMPRLFQIFSFTTPLCIAFVAFSEDSYQGCPRPPEQISRDTETRVRAEVGRLGPISVGALEGEVNRVTRNLLENINENDEVFLAQMMFAAYCPLILNSKQFDDAEKAERLLLFRQQVNSTVQEEGAACPTSSPINMVGRVASDIPGTPLQLGQAVTSVIDKNTRPVDVYSIELDAGQSVRFRIQCNDFCSLSLWNPNTINVRSSSAAVFTVRSHDNREGFEAYTAAVDGTYLVSIRASRSGDRYIASVQPVQ